MAAQRADDLILCGGGVIGLAMAWQAARLGWRVRILERKRLGSGASWAGAGILPPGALQNAHDPMEQLRALSDEMFPDWCDALCSETGIDVGFRRCGGVYLARSNGEFSTLLANQAWWGDHGIAFQRWTAKEIAEHIPVLKPATNSAPLIAAWYLSGECQIRNPRYIKALAVACQKLGVAIHEEESMLQFEPNGGGIVVRTAKNHYASERMCITAGAWTPLAISDKKIQTGILPIRGQMVLFRSKARLFIPVINEGHRYLVPRDDGYLLAGSCEEEAGFDESTTPEMIEQLTCWARQLVPALEFASVERSWSGLRPGSMDGLPYLGKLPEYENVYIAAGHYRHGIHLSPITALTMISLMTGAIPPLDLSPFRMARGKTCA